MNPLCHKHRMTAARRMDGRNILPSASYLNHMASGLTGRMVWALVYLCFAFGPAAAQKVTVAIADFRNETGLFFHSRLEKTVPEMLKTDLAQTGAVTVVERGRLQAVFDEQALGQSGVLDAQQAQQVGRLVGAQYVLSGEISRSVGRFRIDTHIVRVETGEVAGEKVTGPDAGAITSMVRMLAANVAFNLTGHGDHIPRARLHSYPYQWPFACAVGAGIAAGILHHQYRQEYTAYETSGRFDDITRHYERANNNFRARNIVLIAAAAALTSGVILWQENRSDDNYLLAHHALVAPGRLLLMPGFNPEHQGFAFRIAWVQ